MGPLYEYISDDLENLSIKVDQFQYDIDLLAKGQVYQKYLIPKTLDKLQSMIRRLEFSDQEADDVLRFSSRLDNITRTLLNRVIEGTIGERVLRSFIDTLEEFQYKVEVGIDFVKTMNLLNYFGVVLNWEDRWSDAKDRLSIRLSKILDSLSYTNMIPQLDWTEMLELLRSVYGKSERSAIKRLEEHGTVFVK